MTMIIEDSEEISVDLLNILLTSARKENRVIAFYSFLYHLLSIYVPSNGQH